MILVAGATGLLGREICRRLAAQGRAVRGLVRSTSDPDVVALLRSWGVDTVPGDLRDPVSLFEACRGVDAVISTVTTTRSRQPGDGLEETDQRGQANLVDAAGAAGARRFALVSFSGHIQGDDALTHAKRAVERHLRVSGIAYTVLRPSYFMEVWLSPALGFDPAAGRATIYGSGEAPISWVSLTDVAAFAVRSLSDPTMEDATIEIGGPEALSPNEVVRIFEQLSGRPFQVQHVPEAALRAQYQTSTDPLQRAFASLMLSYAAGDAIPMQDTLQLYPIPLRSVREYAAGVLAPDAVAPTPVR